MKNWFRNLTKTLVAAYVFFGLSVLILAAVAYFLINIDVLKNWTIQLPGQKIHVGDTIVVQSVYEKTMNAEGNATRYLECKNRDDIYLRYPLSEAVANRSAGKKGTGIELVMPETIPDVPATCRIAIVIRYEVLPFRHVIEAQESKEFTLYPPEKPAANTGDSDELAQTN